MLGLDVAGLQLLTTSKYPFRFGSGGRERRRDWSETGTGSADDEFCLGVDLFILDLRPPNGDSERFLPLLVLDGS